MAHELFAAGRAPLNDETLAPPLFWTPQNGAGCRCGPLLTQHFESIDKVGHIGASLLLVHGTRDSLILPALGRKLYEAASGPKAFVLVEGGSHHNSNELGQAQYRVALASLFGPVPLQARAAGG